MTMKSKMTLSIVLSAIVSFMLYNRQCTPDCGYKFNQLKVYSYTVHLHHWLISLLVLPFVNNSILKGLLIGGVVHGILMYDDWYEIIKYKE
jgi:hypothetical protein